MLSKKRLVVMNNIRQSVGVMFPLSHPIVQREMRNECLMCGESLGKMKFIAQQGLHIHLCRKCRDKAVRLAVLKLIGQNIEKHVQLPMRVFK